MSQIHPVSPSRLLRRMCTRCGYRGRELQSARGDVSACFVCPRCGQDLYAHPPRSYAEMEGLDDLVEPPLIDRLSTMLGSALDASPPEPAGPRRLFRWVGVGVLCLAVAAAACAMTIVLAAG